MSWLDDLGQGISDAWKGFTGQAQAEAMQGANSANVQMARETNAQNLELTHEQWAREDNATQRRAADLKAAGINPLLAAGSAASASPAAQMMAPRVDAVKPANPIGAGLELAQVVGSLTGNITSIMKTIADTHLVQAQTAGQAIGNAFQGAANPLKLSSMGLDVDLQKATNPAKIQLLDAQLSSAKAQSFMDNLNKIWNEFTDMSKVPKDSSGKPISDPGVDSNFARMKTAQMIQSEAQSRISNIGVDSAHQDFLSKVVALQVSGMQEQILKRTMQFDPGLAQMLKQYFDIAGSAMNTAMKF